MPTAIVDKEKNNSDTCSIPEVNTMVPDDRLQRELSLEENAATGMYYNSFASYKENCIDEAKITSLGSCESISRSFIEWERSWYVDTYTDVASDQQADDPVAFSKLSEAKLSDQGVESDDLPSILSSGRSDVSGTEDVLDLEDYEKVDDISHREVSTVGADDSLVPEEFVYATQSQFAKPELWEYYFLVSTSFLSSIPSLEENKPLEDEERVKSCVLTSPGANSVGRDEEVSEDDWVVI
ncbi:hypothetical protein DCAR_0104277 [Daucus carota subsp. sativus]|uniref:Uncharacterized protein n=1 Tax=Daucus carota subsp. sativus TaxID=79200 RepID=A0AAF0WBQ9_DAUCS|nr:hypothetical protein DCAR_0104277 [Daucus carota subsp. sativus]